MTIRLPTHAAAAALIAVALGALPALAQSTPDQPPAAAPAPAPTQPPGIAPSPMPAPTQPPANGRRMTRLDQHIAEMHRRLHITAAQEPQWQAFAQVMRENAARMDTAFKARSAQGADMNAVDDLKTYAAVAQTHAEDVQRLVPAFEQLYGALTPAQRKDADVMFRSFERRSKRHSNG